MNQRGVVFSMAAILLSLTLLLLVTYYSSKITLDTQDLYNQFSIRKMGIVADDLDVDLNKILGTQFDVNRGTNSTTIRITEKLPADINKLKILDWNRFVDQNYARQQNATIQLDVGKLTDGKTEYLFSNGLQYDYNYGSVNYVHLYKAGLNSNMMRLDINVTVNAASISKTAWTLNPAGDINVNLNYLDQNASNTVNQSGVLDSSILNSYVWDFGPGGSDRFTIQVGNIDGNLKAVKLIESITNSSTVATVSLRVDVNESLSSLTRYYDAGIFYQQGDVNLNRRMGLQYE